MIGSCGTNSFFLPGSLTLKLSIKLLLRIYSMPNAVLRPLRNTLEMSSTWFHPQVSQPIRKQVLWGLF